ncbi:hypothetical protein GCM10027456_75780 [Kineosporia babensis]
MTENQFPGGRADTQARPAHFTESAPHLIRLFRGSAARQPPRLQMPRPEQTGRVNNRGLKLNQGLHPQPGRR